MEHSLHFGWVLDELNDLEQRFKTILDASLPNKQQHTAAVEMLRSHVNASREKCFPPKLTPEAPPSVTMLIENGIPRRSNMLRWIPEEHAVRQLMAQVESLGAHPLLTDAVVLLGQVRDKIADWAESTGNIPPK